ncbi:MAG TPA: MFS transporter [Patescibacteria group bacterium]|nr:MFS transporter [Patescibacteria group bacterium]
MASETSAKKSNILSYGLLVMALTHTLTHVFGRLYTASFPIIREEFNLSIQQLGVIAAIPPLCQAVFSIPFGLLADRFGSKRMLIVSLVVAVAGSLLAASAANPFMLILAVSLVYLNTTIYHPAAYSYITRLFKRGDRPKALGIHGAGGTFGMSLGPLTLSLFLGNFGLNWRHVYLFWAVPIMLGTLLSLRLSDDEFEENDNRPEMGSPEVQDGPTSLLTKALAIFLIYTAIRSIAAQMVGTFMPIIIVDVKGFSTGQMGFIYGLTSLTGLVSSPLGGVISSKVGNKKWLTVSVILSLCMLGLVAVVPGGLPFILVYILYGFSGTLGMAARSTLIAGLTPSNQRGLGYSLLFLPGSIVGAISPIIAATLIGNFGIGLLFPISMFISAIGILVLVFGIKDPEQP